MILVAHAAALGGCDDPARTMGPMRANTELVGLWQGPMEGPVGSSVLTLRLHADSTMTVDNSNTLYRRLDGLWTVSGNRFVATGTPGDGVIVTLEANGPFVWLRGTWSSNEYSGSFDLSKR
jgi:hypothetical protein